MLFNFIFVSWFSILFMVLFKNWLTDKYSFSLTYSFLVFDVILVTIYGLTALTSGLKFNLVILKSLNWSLDFDCPMLLTMDGLSSAFATLLYTALVICFVFLRSYFEVDFFSKNICFLSAIFSQLALGFFMTGDLILLIFFWEWISLVSFFLIQYWSFRLNTLKVSVRVFLVSQLGDLLFICGSFVLLTFARTSDLSILANVYVMQNSIYTNAEYFNLPITLLDLSTVAMTSAVFLKSAQVVYYPWLLDAMEAPVPISSQLHSSTLVIIGFYIVFRLYPLFCGSLLVKCLFIIAGSLTSLSMAVLAFFQFDGKRLLACSTASQLGYCIVALGFGFVNESFVLLFFCCCNKALMFVTFGTIMSKSNGVSDFRFLTGTNANVLEKSVLVSIIGNITIAPGAFIFSVKSTLTSGLVLYDGWVLLLAIDFLSLSWVLSSMYAIGLLSTLFASNFFENTKTSDASSVRKSITHSTVVKSDSTDTWVVSVFTLLLLFGFSYLTYTYNVNLGCYFHNPDSLNRLSY